MVTDKKPVKLVRITTVPISLEKLLQGQMRFMTESGFDVCMISSAYADRKQLEQKEKSRYITVNMTRSISPFSDLLSLFRIIWVLLKEKPVIVHTHTPKAGLLGMMAAWICRVPIRLHTVAGLPLMETNGLKRKVLELVEKVTYGCALRVYPNSIKLKEFIGEQKYCKEAKLKVLGKGGSNGIDTEVFKRTGDLERVGAAIKSKHHIDPGDFVFVFVGRIVKDKGIEELIIAFKNLSQRHANIKLLLVGSTEPELDPLSESCENEIKTNSQIITIGYQADVRPYLTISNALVFPSYREGFPNVPMQAGCFDLPSIVTDINGCNEIIEHEVNGLIIPVKSATALQTAMERIVEDRALYAKVQSNARRIIVERYEQTHFWSLLLNEYQLQLNINEVIS
jgi:glycosyltransferase involved in cell wall biosynthesis